MTDLTPDVLGREVRRLWVETVRQLISNPKRSWTEPWEDLDEFQRAADTAIGVGIADLVRRATPPGAVTAVQLTYDADWETLAAWAGGTLRNHEIADSGEYETTLTLPDGQVASENDWLIKTGEGVTIAEQTADPGAWPLPPDSLEGMLREMHTRFGLHRGWMPPFPTADVPADIRDARIGLMAEEFNELLAALADQNLIKIADGVADLITATAGTGVVYGLPVDALIAEVYDSNMTKTNDPDNPKLVKGPGYEPPAIDAVLIGACADERLRRWAPA